MIRTSTNHSNMMWLTLIRTVPQSTTYLQLWAQSKVMDSWLHPSPTNRWPVVMGSFPNYFTSMADYSNQTGHSITKWQWESYCNRSIVSQMSRAKLSSPWCHSILTSTFACLWGWRNHRADAWSHLSSTVKCISVESASHFGYNHWELNQVQINSKQRRYQLLRNVLPAIAISPLMDQFGIRGFTILIFAGK